MEPASDSDLALRAPPSASMYSASRRNGTERTTDETRQKEKETQSDIDKKVLLTYNRVVVFKLGYAHLLISFFHPSTFWFRGSIWL